PIVNQPSQRDQYVEGVRDPRAHERQPDRRHVEERRQLALQVPPDRVRQHGIGPVPSQQRRLQQQPRDTRHQEHHPVARRGYRRRRILSDPPRRERPEQQAEEEEQGRRQEAARAG